MLHETVQTLHLEAIRSELEKSTEHINCLDNQGQTPLHWAVMAGNCEVVKLLLEFGADPNKPSGAGAYVTPYWHATEDFGLHEIANLLALHSATPAHDS
jgi:ankyrin repeat protein